MSLGCEVAPVGRPFLDVLVTEALLFWGSYGYQINCVLPRIGCEFSWNWCWNEVETCAWVVAGVGRDKDQHRRASVAEA